MSMRFWIGSGTAIVACAAFGLGLGNYVTTMPTGAAASEATNGADPLSVDIPPSLSADSSPTGPIICTGCGPTLADRQMHVDRGAMDFDGMISGSSDPAVQRYLAESSDTPPLRDIPPSPLHQLPPDAERFAAGESSPLTPPPPMRATIASTAPMAAPAPLVSAPPR